MCNVAFLIIYVCMYVCKYICNTPKYICTYPYNSYNLQTGTDRDNNFSYLQTQIDVHLCQDQPLQHIVEPHLSKFLSHLVKEGPQVP